MTDRTSSRPDAFPRIVEQPVGFHRIFDFWIGLAEGLWENRGQLIPLGSTPEEVSTYQIYIPRFLDLTRGVAGRFDRWSRHDNPSTTVQSTWVQIRLVHRTPKELGEPSSSTVARKNYCGTQEGVPSRRQKYPLVLG